MANTFAAIFPDPRDLLALEPEELGAVVLEIVPQILQNEMFSMGGLLAPLFAPPNAPYPRGVHNLVRIAVAEAVSWLMSEGLVILDPDQPASWYRLTRRAQKLRTRADVDAYRKGSILPRGLLLPILVEKAWPLFLRGDHDIAVFQAFKEVEVAVRKKANARGASFPDDLVGVTLMRRGISSGDWPALGSNQGGSRA